MNRSKLFVAGGLILAAMFLLGVPPSISAQLVTQTIPLTPDNVLSFSDPGSTQEELPGLGHKFELLGSMIRDTDPENNVGNSGGSGGGQGGNETISAITAPGSMAFAFRNLPPGIRITALDNQLGLKYYFQAPRTCFGGSPRIVLFIDTDGDGDRDFSANGHVNPISSTGCVMNKWVYEDLTDDLNRWEATPGAFQGMLGLPSFPYAPWEVFENAVATVFPNHKVLSGFLLDGESCQFAAGPVTCGKAYYDLVTIENRTLEIWQDTVKNN